MQDCLLDPDIFEATIIYPVKQLQSCSWCSCLSLALLLFSDTQTDTHTKAGLPLKAGLRPEAGLLPEAGLPPKAGSLPKAGSSHEIGLPLDVGLPSSNILYQ